MLMHGISIIELDNLTIALFKLLVLEKYIIKFPCYNSPTFVNYSPVKDEAGITPYFTI